MWEFAKLAKKYLYEFYKAQNVSKRYYQSGFRSKESSKVKEKEILKVAIIGAPNAGKSTIINQIIERRVFAISKKVHTTKVCARGVYNVRNKQIVFLDTPGLVSSKESERYKLANSFLTGGENAVVEADLIGVIHDVSNPHYRYSLDPKVLRLLHIYKDKESFLVLNKIDTLKSKTQLLDLSTKLTGGKLSKEKNIKEPISEIDLRNIIKTEHHWEFFSNVFMTSALLDKGIRELRNFLLKKTNIGEWIFPTDAFTDQKPIEIIEEAVRSKLLEHLPEEIPYNVDVELEYLDMEREEMIFAVVLIHCYSTRLLGLIKGIKGARIQMIANEAEQAIADAFLTGVNLKLVITDEQPKVEKRFHK